MELIAALISINITYFLSITLWFPSYLNVKRDQLWIARGRRENRFNFTFKLTSGRPVYEMIKQECRDVHFTNLLWWENGPYMKTQNHCIEAIAQWKSHLEEKEENASLLLSRGWWIWKDRWKWQKGAISLEWFLTGQIDPGFHALHDMPLINHWNIGENDRKLQYLWNDF